MPTANLAAVTRTLQTLLTRRVSDLAGRTVQVTMRPPERVGTETNVVNIHLYHVREDPNFRNAAGAGAGTPDVARAPLGLSLYYILTAHHDSGGDETQDALEQQMLLGCALKALHDTPVIDGHTDVGGPVLDPAFGDGDELEVLLRPLTPEDSVTFWSAEDQQTTRLSAYYEVRVVFLEPDQPTPPAPPVLSLGAFFTDVGAAHLDGTESVLLFAPPGYVGTPARVPSRPARVVAAPGGPPDARQDHLDAPGAHLGGLRQRIFVASQRWAARTPPVTRVEVTAASGWSVRVGSRGVGLDIAATITDGATTLDALPGVYTLAVEVVRDEVTIAGRAKDLVVRSNEVPFFICVSPLAHSAPDGTGRITVDIAPGAPLDHPDLAGELGLVVDGQAYGLVGAFTGDPATDRGTYVIAGPTQLVLQPRFATDVAGIHPLRLLVGGAESRPFWIVVVGP